MPVPVPRHLEAARASLADWLETKLSARPQISEITGPAATGYSNETLLFDAAWHEGDIERRAGFAVRVQPTGYAIFLESEFDTQYRVIEALGAHTDVPVPRVHWYEDDPSVLGAPFFVMDRVSGQTPSDNPPYTMEGWLLDASPHEQERLWWSALDALVRIHRVDPFALGLDFLDRPKRGRPGLGQQLAYYEEYLTWASRGRPQPIAEAAFEWVQRNRPAEDGPVGLCWGDSRIGNIIFQDFEAAAVLDWEMVALGDPLQDLAWWLFLDRHHSEGLTVPRLPGFPGREDTVTRYEELTDRKVDADLLDFYEVFAGFRFAVVMMRVAQMCIEYELIPPDSDLETNNTVTQLLSKMLG